MERFGVSRPSLREALRILEAEGLVTVVRGVRGGVVVHEPDGRMTARTAALLLQARNVPLADVFQARSLLEPITAKTIAKMRGRRAAIKELRMLISEEEAAIEEPERFGVANAKFHARLVSLAGNQTLGIVAEMLNEIVARAVTAVSRADVVGSLSVRRRGLLELLESGDGAAAEEHWRSHMQIVGRVMLGREASTVVDLLDHDAAFVERRRRRSGLAAAGRRPLARHGAPAFDRPRRSLHPRQSSTPSRQVHLSPTTSRKTVCG